MGLDVWEYCVKPVVQWSVERGNELMGKKSKTQERVLLFVYEGVGEMRSDEAWHEGTEGGEINNNERYKMQMSEESGTQGGTRKARERKAKRCKGSNVNNLVPMESPLWSGSAARILSKCEKASQEVKERTGLKGGENNTGAAQPDRAACCN